MSNSRAHTLRFQALEISDFTYNELCEPSAVDHFEIYENTDAVFENMEVTFEFLGL